MTERPIGKLHIGTSGWHYPHWRGPFYPEDLPPPEFLSYYARHFRSVEINATFYRLPAPTTFSAWAGAVPDDFAFAVKASRYITHMKKLKDPRAPLRRLYDAIEGLAGKLGPVLFQLPPRWGFNAQRLRAFLDALSTCYRYAFEFRDPSWFDERALDMLADVGASACVYDLAGRSSPRVVTGDLVYVRLHGPGDAYRGSYGTPALRSWAETLHAWREQGLEVFCYFNNDEAGYAVRNALTLTGRSTP